MEKSTNREICYRLRRIGNPATVKDVADVFVLQQNITVIGRARNNVDFFIDSSKHKALISRIHARICKSRTHCGEDVFKIYDVSLNGTYVNDVKISSEASIKPGDVVTFGHMQGACLESGCSYKQLNSEFKFLFEKFCDGEKSDGLPNVDYETATIKDETPVLPKFLETPTTLTMQSENCLTTKRSLTFENSDGNDFKMLQEYASSAVSTFTKQNESDEDLFSTMHTHRCEENKKGPEKKRRRSKQDSQASNEICSASKCVKPDGKIVSWVQCDDCDKWYHIKCCGLSLRLVKAKNSKFHCGCS